MPAISRPARRGRRWRRARRRAARPAASSGSPFGRSRPVGCAMGVPPVRSWQTAASLGGRLSAAHGPDERDAAAAATGTTAASLQTCPHRATPDDDPLADIEPEAGALPTGLVVSKGSRMGRRRARECRGRCRRSRPGPGRRRGRCARSAGRGRPCRQNAMPSGPPGLVGRGQGQPKALCHAGSAVHRI